MKLECEDKQAIFEIVAARYFKTQNWKWVNLRTEINKIFKAYEELNEQYASYSYVSRDWYVENMGSKNIHMCRTWEELKNLVAFLNTHAEVFNFLVNTGSRKSFCIVSDSKDLTEPQSMAIKEVQKLGYNTFVFLATVPDEIEFQLLQVRGVN
ncbi:TPA: hypothetical protein HA351_03120 [Methanosarcinaceae archaeon]|nr:hypothetical protein [Methanosarcinaceae archaeon]